MKYIPIRDDSIFTLRNHNPQYLKLLKEIKNSKIIDNVAIVAEDLLKIKELIQLLNM